MPNIGFGELAIVLAIVLLVFGPKRLPDVAQGIGKSFRAFKEGLKEITAAKEDIRMEATAKPEKKQT